MSVPATVPSAVCPSAKVTVTWLPRTLCALVSTRFWPSTMPEPTPHRCPMPTTGRRPHVAYQLTAEGREPAGALPLLAAWGAGHADPAQAPVHPACGTPVEARWYCPTCDHLVDDQPQADVRYV